MGSSGAASGAYRGPARALVTEKTGESGLGPGSVVWISYVARLYRCSPEQLRLCVQLHGSLPVIYEQLGKKV